MMAPCQCGFPFRGPGASTGAPLAEEGFRSIPAREETIPDPATEAKKAPTSSGAPLPIHSASTGK